MRVYRYLSGEELEKMKANDVKSLGSTFSPSEDHPNTYRYKSGKKYIHFFLSKKTCQYMIEVNRDANGADGTIPNRYICTFNIPIAKLVRYYGKGYYYPLGYTSSSGYEDLYAKVVKREFALDADIFDSSWLESVEPAKRLTPINNPGRTEHDREL